VTAAPQKPCIESRIKPPALRSGDKVALLRPRRTSSANCWRRDVTAFALLDMSRLSALDFRSGPLFCGVGRAAGARSGRDVVRDDVRAIICARGGYGSNYLLNAIDLAKIIAHPKIFVGYSDLTTLLTWFADNAGW